MVSLSCEDWGGDGCRQAHCLKQWHTGEPPPCPFQAFYTGAFNARACHPPLKRVSDPFVLPIFTFVCGFGRGWGACWPMNKGAADPPPAWVWVV